MKITKSSLSLLVFSSVLCMNSYANSEFKKTPKPNLDEIHKLKIYKSSDCSNLVIEDDSYLDLTAKSFLDENLECDTLEFKKGAILFIDGDLDLTVESLIGDVRIVGLNQYKKYPNPAKNLNPRARNGLNGRSMPKGVNGRNAGEKVGTRKKRIRVCVLGACYTDYINEPYIDRWGSTPGEDGKNGYPGTAGHHGFSGENGKDGIKGNNVHIKINKDLNDLDSLYFELLGSDGGNGADAQDGGHGGNGGNGGNGGKGGSRHRELRASHGGNGGHGGSAGNGGNGGDGGNGGHGGNGGNIIITSSTFDVKKLANLLNNSEAMFNYGGNGGSGGRAGKKGLSGTPGNGGRGGKGGSGGMLGHGSRGGSNRGLGARGANGVNGQSGQNGKNGHRGDRGGITVIKKVERTDELDISNNASIDLDDILED